MAHIQNLYSKLWKPQDLTIDKISSQRMFIDNIDLLEEFALSVLKRTAIPVASIEALRTIDTSDTTLYSDGMTIMIKSNGIYFFDRGNTTADNGTTVIAPTNGGGRWISDTIFITNMGMIGNVPNVATNDQTPTYTQASTLATLVSGEKLSVSMGKIMKGLTDLISHLANKSNPHSVTAIQLGLGNVSNTSDVNKPVSTAQATAIADAKKAGTDAQTNLTIHINNKTNPHEVTKTQLGLGNVDNTSDTSKPVSTAQATAIADAKKAGTDAQAGLDLHTGSTSNPHNVTKAQVGLGNVPNVVTNDQTPTYTQASTLATLVSGEKVSVSFGKIMKGLTDLISHLANKSNPHEITKAQVGLSDVPNVATNDQTPTYTTATSLSALVSGEKLSVSMGKIAKAIADLGTHLVNKSNPHTVTKAQVGLGNVDNTSDLNKPVSTAMQTALNGKANMINGEVPTASYLRLTGFSLLNGIDLNTIKYSGQYGISTSCLNRPVSTGTYDMMEVIMYSSHWLIQKYYVLNSAGVISSIYMRAYISDSTWTAWKLYNLGTGNTLAVAEVV